MNWEQVMAWAESVSKLAPLGTLFVACLGAIYTIKQFERAKRVRAVDLAISLTGQLDTVPELSFACQALDWGFGPLIVPERYRALLEKRGVDGAAPTTPEDRGEVIEHDVKIMVKALRPDIGFSVRGEPVYLVYRYCFDKLFQHLENIDRLVEAGQLAAADLGALNYWLTRIARFEYPPAGTAPEEVFQPFLEDKGFDYCRVITLGKRLGVAGWRRP